MKRGSSSRVPGWAVTKSVTGCLIPAATSSSCSANTVVPSLPRTTSAWTRVRVRNRSYAEPSFTPTRTPGRSTSVAVVRGESAGTAKTPSITAYGAVNATVSARAGSTARKQMSARPPAIASKESRAASKQTSSTGSPSRPPSSRAMSTVTPRGASAVPWASTGLPRLIEARSVPVGARSSVMSTTRMLPAAPPVVADPTQPSGRCMTPRTLPNGSTTLAPTYPAPKSRGGHWLVAPIPSSRSYAASASSTCQ